jgi:hypothetical protein
MTTKTILIAVFLPALAVAQSAPKRTQAPSKPSSAATSPQNGKGQKDAAAKGSGSHTNNMIGNHKDVMEATAPAPATGGKTQPATSSAASPAAQPAPNRPKK